MRPSLARRAGWIAGGVVVPAVFLGEVSPRVVPGPVLAFLAIPLAGMALHALAPFPFVRRVTLPAILVGLLGAWPMILVAPVLFPIPLLAFATYLDAMGWHLSSSRTCDRDLLCAVAGALAYLSLPVLAHWHFRGAVRDLEAARTSREVARSMDAIEIHGTRGRREIHRVFFSSGSDKQRWMEALSLERRGTSLLEEAAAERWRR